MIIYIFAFSTSFLVLLCLLAVLVHPSVVVVSHMMWMLHYVSNNINKLPNTKNSSNATHHKEEKNARPSQPRAVPHQN